MSEKITIEAEAVDNASKEIAKIGDNVEKSMAKVEQRNQSVVRSMKDVTVGVSGVATSAFSLYNAYDRVADMQLQVDRSNLMVKQSANSAEDAQRRQANAGIALENAQEAAAQALEKSGSNSKEYADAMAKVDKAASDYNASISDAKLSTERYGLAVERAKQTQDNFNEAIVQSALQIVPTVITMVDSVMKVVKVFETMKTAADAAKVAAIAANTAGAAGGAAGGVGALGTAAMAVPVVGGIAATVYLGATTTESKIQKAITPAGLPEMPLRPGQTEGPFGLPTLDVGGAIKKAIDDFIHNVLHLAEGGTVTGPVLAVLGEGGQKEHVIPDDKMKALGVTIDARTYIGTITGVDDLESKLENNNRRLAEVVRRELS
jgi:hypothetical protein